MSAQLACPQRSLLLGLSETDLALVPELGCQLHINVVEPFLQLCNSARQAGFCIQVASSFRSFARQLQIWNAKANGQRPVFDFSGQPIDIAQLTDLQKVHAILRWSALPGSSRHHWGTDMDVYDSSVVSSDYRVQLTADECCDAGPFAPFHTWLTSAIVTDSSFGFYRPYAIDSGGIAPELWHLSYAPLAESFARQRTEALLKAQIEMVDIALKPTILEHFSALYQRYVLIPA